MQIRTASIRRCTVSVYCKTYKRVQDLKTHRTRTGHFGDKKDKVTKEAVTNVVIQKRKVMQSNLPKVRWGEREVDNVWQIKYLGSIFEAGGGDMTDVWTRISMVTQWFDKLRNIWWDDNLHLNLRMRLYKSCVYNVLTYGFEAWRMTRKVAAALNGTNSKMVTVITGRAIHAETVSEKTFDIVMWIRTRWLQWIGHILRIGARRRAHDQTDNVRKCISVP